MWAFWGLASVGSLMGCTGSFKSSATETGSSSATEPATTWTGTSTTTAGTTDPPPTTTTEPTGASDGPLTAGVWDDNWNYHDWFLPYLDWAEELSGAPSFYRSEREEALQTFGGGFEPHLDLELAILFDTTGSMGDELEYLTDELESIAADIAAAVPAAEVRWGLVVYRDLNDVYITQTYDFTTDLTQFQGDLASQSAAGGNDYPEATPEGLDAVLDLGWSSDPDVARLVFWIADAPHHTEDADLVASELRRALAQGVHLYPVAASGADLLTEYTMRSAAQLTGGRYLFLTDDSGVGLPHAEPNIPCYFVTTLRDAMVRMVELELSGVYTPPLAEQIVRTTGDPEDGLCTLDTGATALAF
jgi:hypothetical protein